MGVRLCVCGDEAEAEGRKMCVWGEGVSVSERERERKREREKEREKGKGRKREKNRARDEVRNLPKKNRCHHTHPSLEVSTPGLFETQVQFSPIGGFLPLVLWCMEWVRSIERDPF